MLKIGLYGSNNERKPIKEAVTSLCPNDTYLLNNKEYIRKILHDEIEYIKRKKRKSFIYLSNGDIEETPISLVQIEKELGKSHFAKCSNACIVNIFNIDRISEKWDSIALKSGTEIPMSRYGQKNLLKALSISQTGTNVFNY